MIPSPYVSATSGWGIVVATYLLHSCTNLLAQDFGKRHLIHTDDIKRCWLLLDDCASQLHADEASTDDNDLCILVQAYRREVMSESLLSEDS